MTMEERPKVFKETFSAYYAKLYSLEKALLVEFNDENISLISWFGRTW